MAGKSVNKPLMIYYGPQHPGAPGNVAYKLWLDGERVVDAELVPGFLLRGFEKMMENRTWEMNIVIGYRFCVEEPDSLELGYAEAIDRLLKYEIPEKAKWVRMIQHEFGRAASHLFWANYMSGSVGLRTTGFWSITAREEILKWFYKVVGHRIYHSYSVPGGIRWDVPKDFKEFTIKTTNRVEELVNDIESALLKNFVFKARTKGVGVIRGDDALKLGITGPALRAAGVAYDIRKAVPYENYDKVDFIIPTGENGDSYDRAVVRFKEIHQSMKIIRQAVEEVRPGDPWRIKLPLTVPPGVGIARVESARGEYMIHVVSQGGRKPYRVRLRSVSMPLMTTAIKHVVENEEVTIADFPVILGSLDPCAPDIDR